MTETDYFDALGDLLRPALKDAPKVPGGHYLIEESGQVSFALNTRNLALHQAIKLESMKTDWPCFREMHSYAHKRCDRVIVTWDRIAKRPKYLLVELKSSSSRGANTQLGVSLAFCHFLHRMICLGHQTHPEPSFGAVTVKTMPFSLKVTSIPKVPAWNPQPLQFDCKHMHYPRSNGSLPISAILALV